MTFRIAHNLLAPAIILMNRLSFSLKFALLGVITLLAISVALYGFYTNLHRVVMTSQREIKGLELVDSLSKVVQVLQKHRGMSTGILSGMDSFRSQLPPLEHEVDNAFANFETNLSSSPGYLEKFSAMQLLWGRIHDRGLQWTQGENFSTHTRLIDKLMMFETELADNYGLTTDPDLDTFYLAHATVNELMELLEHLGQVRAYGTGMIASGHPSEAQKEKIDSLISQVIDSFDRLRESLDKVVLFNPQMKEVLFATYQEIETSFRPVTNEMSSGIKQGHFSLSATEFFNLATRSIDRGYSQMHQDLLQMNNSLLQNRIQRAEMELIATAGIAVLLLLLVTYLMVAIYYTTRVSIHSLAQTVGNFVRGDMQSRVQLDTRDELALIGESFNAMADELYDLLQSQRATTNYARSLIEASLDPLMTISTEGKITDVNSAAENVTGLPRANLIGSDFGEHFTEPDKARQGYLHAFLQGFIKDYPLAIRHQSGRITEVLYNGSVFRNENGEVLGVFAAARDITERLKVEMRMVALIHRNAVLMQSTSEGIHIMDDQGRILEANDAFCRHLGYSPEEMLKLSLFDFEAKLTAVEVMENLRTLLQGHKVFESLHRRKDGSLVDVEVSISGVELEGKNCLYALCREITERKIAENEIKRLAYFDPLTGLANRRLLTDRMDKALAHARRHNELVAVFMIDLDGFKQVNDEMGHNAGDLLLVEVARRLQDCIRDSDSAARFGGDEFSVILSGLTRTSECEQTLKRVITALAAPYQVVGGIAHVTASIGATIFPNDDSSPDLLMRHADQTMYEAKQAGKNCYRLYNPSQHDQQLANQAAVRKIEKALHKGQLVLLYQPQFDCLLGRVIGVEALIRWNHPILGMLSPSEFIPLLEHDDLIVTVGEWVILEALKQLTEWHAIGLELTVGVNISARQLHQSNFVRRLEELIAPFNQEVINHLEIEILESAALENIEIVAEAIRQCRSLGMHICIDDFGTGYSSLAHLKNLRVDALKIDQSFVLGMLHNPEDLAIAGGVIALAASFRYKVIAEGVESVDHVLMLKDIGCSIMQGFLIARPMAAERIPSWLQSFKPDPLWQLSRQERPSREYFEVLLAVTNHRYWIEQQVDLRGNPQESSQAELLQDDHQCRLGHWYYGTGARLAGKQPLFDALEPVHKRIHQIAARLCAYKHTEDEQSVQVEAVLLQKEQDKLDGLLAELKRSLADNYININ